MFRPWESTDTDKNEENNFGLLGNLANSVDETGTVPKKTKMHLSLCCKEMVVRVYQGLLKYFNTSEALKMTGELTQVSSSTVWRIIDTNRKGESLEKKTRCDKGLLRKLNEEDAKIIGRTIYSMYNRNEIPTVDSLKKEVNADMDYPRIACSRETLRKFIIENGFNFKIIDKRQAIMETERLQRWRLDYLSKIDNFRKENRPIFYLDETWFDTHDTIKKGWVDDSSKCRLNVPSSRGKRITILHCGWENGWVADALLLSAKNINDCSLDYHQDMTAELFEKWFECTLLPKLPPNSVIVLDNASYHSRLSEKIPTTSSNKTEIKGFLSKHDLFFEETYSKKELLEVLHTKNFDKQYVIDDMSEKNGHTVLRLPPYHCIFNPIELIWGQLKEKIRRHNTSPKFSSSVLELIKTETSSIGADNWKNSIRHVTGVENKFRKLSENVDSFVISRDSDSSDSDDGIFDQE